MTKDDDLPKASWEHACAIARRLADRRRLDLRDVALSRVAGHILAVDVMATTGESGGGGVASGPCPLLSAGQPLTPARLALAASLGLATLRVSRKPSVAVYTVGDDLIAPGMSLPAGCRFDSARELLMGLLREEGLEPTAWPRLPDDLRQLEIAVRDASCAFDVVIVCGDAIVRDVNGLSDVVQRFGTIEFSPTHLNGMCSALLGSLDQAVVIGLPADPIDVMATWMTLGRPLIDGLQGRGVARKVWSGQLAAPVSHTSMFVPVRVEQDARSGLRLFPSQADTPLEALAMSDGLAVLPRSQAYAVGDIVEVMRYG